MISRASEADVDQIMALEVSGFAHGQWSRESWAAEVSQPDHLVAVSRADHVVGVIALSDVAGTAELLRVIVEPSLRRRGIGHLLVDKGLEWALQRGDHEVFLEVEAANLGAVKLYLDHGFAAIDTRKDYYGPAADAIVMRTDLGGPKPDHSEEEA